MKFWNRAIIAPLLAVAACASNPGAAPVSGAGPVAAPAAPVYTTAEINGASAAELDALLGEAALVRREGAGEFRRYALSKCSLIVVLYPDESGRMTTREVAASALRAGEANPALVDCLAAG